MFGLFRDPESEEFARRLAKELQTRVPAPVVAKADPSSPEFVRALKHVANRGQEFRRQHKVSIFRQIRLSRALQSELTAGGYEAEFIKEVTLELARAMRAKAE